MPCCRANSWSPGLYGWQEEVASNAIEVHLHHLRRKLGSSWIKNVRGVGYKAGRCLQRPAHGMNTIRARLLVWLIGSLLLVSLLASALTYELAWRGFNTVRDYGLEQIAYSIVRHDTQDWLDDTPDSTDGNAADSTKSDPATAAQDEGQFVSQIWTANGRLIYSSLTDTGPLLQQPGLHLADWDGSRWRTYTLIDRERVIQVATPTSGAGASS